MSEDTFTFEESEDNLHRIKGWVKEPRPKPEEFDGVEELMEKIKKIIGGDNEPES